jgi:hypothetical protein
MHARHASTPDGLEVVEDWTFQRYDGDADVDHPRTRTKEVRRKVALVDGHLSPATKAPDPVP